MAGSLGRGVLAGEPVTLKPGWVTRPGSCQVATPVRGLVQPSGRSVTS